MSVGARGLQRGGTSREAALVNSSLAQPPPRMDRSRRRTGAPSPSGNGQRAFEERQRRRTLAARASHENGRAGREREGKGARARVLRLIRKDEVRVGQQRGTSSARGGRRTPGGHNVSWAVGSGEEGEREGRGGYFAWLKFTELLFCNMS